MATTSSVGDVPVDFQLPRQGGARRGGHDDGGDDLVVLPPGDATPHAAREASQLRRSFFKSDLGATTAMSRCEHSLKLSKKEVIAIGPPRAPARENPAGIDAGERVGTTARRRSGASPRPDAYRVAARPAPPPPPTARRELPSAHRTPRAPRQGRDERDRKPARRPAQPLGRAIASEIGAVIATSDRVARNKPARLFDSGLHFNLRRSAQAKICQNTEHHTRKHADRGSHWASHQHTWASHLSITRP